MYYPYTFTYATLASLTDLVKYADFRDSPVTFVNESASGTQWTEDLPDEDLFSFMVNYTADANRVFNIGNWTVYKGVGRLQNNTNTFSTFVLVDLTSNNRNLDVSRYNSTTQIFLTQSISEVH